MKKTLTLVVAVSVALACVACGDDDSVGQNNNTPYNCTDIDQDGYGVGADCIGPDCNDQDATCWTVGSACCDSLDCTDADGDGYGVGADCTDVDCDDANAQCWTGACCPGDCTDLDGDGYGNGTTCLGTDCDDNDNQCWAGACCGGGGCTDNDGDTYGVGADCAGPDCNDSDAACHTPGDACCPVSAGTTGEPCMDASVCTNITNGTAECLTSIGGFINFPNGYCTGSSCTVGQACDTSGGMCIDLYGYLQYCLLECSDPSDCRVSEGYSCTQLPQAPVTDPTYCLPGTGP
ncbi:MAG: hypothetical protein ABI333_15090 [bacterium]